MMKMMMMLMFGVAKAIWV